MRTLEALGVRVLVSREGRNWVAHLNPVSAVEKPPFSVTAVFYSLAQLEAFLDAFRLGFNLGTQNNKREGGENV
jgi:hypothetical protein